MTSLRQVLTVFEKNTDPLNAYQVAREVHLDQPLVQSMIDFWVQRGDLRPVQMACTTCGVVTACPFVPKVPQRYERVLAPAFLPEKPCGSAHPMAAYGSQD